MDLEGLDLDALEAAAQAAAPQLTHELALAGVAKGLVN
jgi:hypothetical protein